jgi:hypothetical protein
MSGIVQNPQKIDVFESQSVGMSIALLIDTTGSMSASFPT